MSPSFAEITMCGATRTLSDETKWSGMMNALSENEVGLVAGGTTISEAAAAEWELLKAAGRAAEPYVYKAAQWIADLY